MEDLRIKCENAESEIQYKVVHINEQNEKMLQQENIIKCQ